MYPSSAHPHLERPPSRDDKDLNKRVQGKRDGKGANSEGLKVDEDDQ